jgi:hypothetical protein
VAPCRRELARLEPGPVTVTHPAGLTNDSADLVSVGRGPACAAPPDFITRCTELDNLFAYVLVRITVHNERDSAIGSSTLWNTGRAA